MSVRKLRSLLVSAGWGVATLLPVLGAAAPSAPTGLSAANVKAASFTLKWSAATGGTGGIVGYDVYQDSVPLGTTTTRTFAVTGLAPATRI